MLAKRLFIRVRLISYRYASTVASPESEYCDHKCWQCNKINEGCVFFCSGCKKIQPVTQTSHCKDYFQYFGIPKTFNIDVKDLEKKYHAMQMKLHPDLFNNSPNKEKEISTDVSSTINEAYLILKSPLSRAGYLLTLEGKDPFKESSNKPVDQDLLAYVMDVRSEIEEISDNNQLIKINLENEKMMEQVLNQLSDAFKTHNNDEAYKLSIKLQYLSRIKDLLKDKIIYS